MSTPKQTVQANCPTCKRRMPHESVGVEKADDGRRIESLKCNACGTTTTVYDEPDGFQANYELPDDSEA